MAPESISITANCPLIEPTNFNKLVPTVFKRKGSTARAQSGAIAEAAGAIAIFNLEAAAAALTLNLAEEKAVAEEAEAERAETKAGAEADAIAEESDGLRPLVTEGRFVVYSQ